MFYLTDEDIEKSPTDEEDLSKLVEEDDEDEDEDYSDLDDEDMEDDE